MQNEIILSAITRDAIHASLSKRQEAVDQAHAVASLLLDRFAAMAQGQEGPDDSQVMSALQLIVDRLRSCYDLIDFAKLEMEGLMPRLGMVNGSDKQ